MVYLREHYRPFFTVWLLIALCVATPLHAVEGGDPVAWAEGLARSELLRRGDSLSGSNPKARWDYTAGIFSYAVQTLAIQKHDETLEKQAANLVLSFINNEGAIRTYNAADYNLDNVTPGRAVLLANELHPDARLERTVETLRHQLQQQPRTREGGFWHKQRYPQQMWLDGLYMASPFLARYGRLHQEPACFDEVTRQLLLIDRHLYDEGKGLYYHAWDESGSQVWADKATGHSPHFWARAVGWYAMALVDVLDELPPTHPDVEAVNHVLRKVADGLERWQDPATGVWWQVLDQGARPGNYLEASASSMYVYALAKGINRGYLDRAHFEPIVRKAWAGVLKQFVSVDPQGAVSLNRCCEVAGLGFTNAAGRSRDGSFDYYVSEPVISNDLKGVGPFILAGLEMGALDSKAGRQAQGWALAEEIVSRIQPLDIPSVDFPITAYGASSGRDATQALRSALEACAKAGGGHVVVPAGEWNTGPLELQSRTDLHLEKGAILHFSTRPEDYLPAKLLRWEGVECYNFAPLLSARDAHDISITGEGVLDGGASLENWWAWKAGPQKAARDRLIAQGGSGVEVSKRVYGLDDRLRPSFIAPYKCQRVRLEGFTIVRAPMWVLHPVYCENVAVRKVTIDSHGPNNDGCDPDSSRDVLIEECTFDTGDDCIAIKSGRNDDGRRVGLPSENIVIRRCVMKDGHGGVVLGSEISGGVRNVFAEQCRMDSPHLERMLRLKSNAQRGGTLENIFVRDVEVGTLSEAVLAVDFRYEEGAKGAFPPVVRHVVLERIRSSASPRVLKIEGIPKGRIEDIRLSDCVFTGVTATDVISGAERITLERLTLEPRAAK